MPVDLRFIRHAHAVATHGSVNRAAAELGISQPALSRSIGLLEQQLGLPLFARTSRGAEPTDFGAMFLKEAALVVDQVADLERQVAMAKGLETGEVSLGFGPYAADVLGPDCLRHFTHRHPALRLRIHTDGPENVARALRARAIDIAVADASAFEEEDAVEVIVRLPAIRAYVLVRAGHPLVTRTAVTMADILAYPFVQVTRLPPRALKPLLRHRRLAGPPDRLPPFPAVECPSVPLALNAIRDSDAAVVAMLSSVHAELRGGRVRPLLHEPWMCSQWVIAKLRRRSLSPAATAMVAELERVNEQAVKANAASYSTWDRWIASRSTVAKAGSRAGTAGPRRG